MPSNWYSIYRLLLPVLAEILLQNKPLLLSKGPEGNRLKWTIILQAEVPRGVVQYFYWPHCVFLTSSEMQIPESHTSRYGVTDWNPAVPLSLKWVLWKVKGLPKSEWLQNEPNNWCIFFLMYWNWHKFWIKPAFKKELRMGLVCSHSVATQRIW